MAMNKEISEMNKLGILLKELEEKPIEERKEIIRQLIEEKDTTINGVLFDAKNNRSTHILDLADEIGVDACVELLAGLIDAQHVHTKDIGKEEIEELLKKIEKGEATEAEKNLVKFIQHTTNKNNVTDFTTHLLDVLSGFIVFSVERIQYVPMIADIIGTVGVLCTVAMVDSDENQGLSKYRTPEGYEAVVEVATQMGDDILNTWKPTLTQEPDPSLVIVSLLYAANKVARDAGYKFVDADALLETFGLCNCDEGCEHDCDCNGHCECGNGSNESDSNNEEKVEE